MHLGLSIFLEFLTAYGDAFPAVRYPEGDEAVALGKELN